MKKFEPFPFGNGPLSPFIFTADRRNQGQTEFSVGANFLDLLIVRKFGKAIHPKFENFGAEAFGFAKERRFFPAVQRDGDDAGFVERRPTDFQEHPIELPQFRHL